MGQSLCAEEQSISSVAGEVNIMVVGDHGVGKRSLVARFCDGSSQLVEKTEPAAQVGGNREAGEHTLIQEEASTMPYKDAIIPIVKERFIELDAGVNGIGNKPVQMMLRSVGGGVRSVQRSNNYSNNGGDSAEMSPFGEKAQSAVIYTAQHNLARQEFNARLRNSARDNGWYKTADGVVLVYDVGDKSSFKGLSLWNSEVLQQRAEQHPVPTLLIGNKTDDMRPRGVSYDTARQWAERKGMQYFETSAKQGSNVDRAFFAIATQVLGF